MTYSDLSTLIKSKGYRIDYIAKEVGYTRAGLQKAIDKETIELRKLKKLCELLKVKPEVFF